MATQAVVVREVSTTPPTVYSQTRQIPGGSGSSRPTKGQVYPRPK